MPRLEPSLAALCALPLLLSLPGAPARAEDGRLNPEESRIRNTSLKSQSGFSPTSTSRSSKPMTSSSFWIASLPESASFWSE